MRALIEPKLTRQITDIISYLERRLEEENHRVLQYLDSTTRKPLILTVEAVALAAHVQEILDKGKPAFHQLLSSTRF